MANKYTQEGKANKIKYIKNYNKRTYRTVNIKFRMDDPNQAAVWEWLHTRYSTAGFLRDLAIDTMKKEKGE